MLTILGVGIPLFLFNTVLTIMATFGALIEASSKSPRVVVRNAASLVFPMPESYLQKVRAVPGVVEVMPSSWFGGVFKDEREAFPQFAVDPKTLPAVWPDVAITPEGAKEKFQKIRTAAIISHDQADKRGIKVGDRITIKGRIFPVDLDLEVVGFADRKQALMGALYFNREYLHELHPPHKGRIGTIWVMAQSLDDLPRISADIDRQFRNSSDETTTETEKAFLSTFLSASGGIQSLILAIGGVVVFTILLVSGNTMAMTARERTAEVGILKAVGFRGGHILGLLLGESVLIAVLGGIVGSLLAYTLLTRMVGNWMPLLRGVKLRPEAIVQAIVISGAMGVLAGILPALGAARLRVVDALRRVA